MKMDLIRLVRRLETAQAQQSRSFLLEAIRKNANGSACALRGRWGFAHYFAEGHFLNQALALGLRGPVASAQLERVERLLGKGGHPVVLELAPTAHADLPRLLAERGYCIQSFQHVLEKKINSRISTATPDWDSQVQVRRIEAQEMVLWCQVVHAGFLSVDTLGSGEEAASGFSAEAAGNQLYLATVDGHPAGAAVLGCFNGVGVCSGTSVLPRFRGLGAQRALVAARLEAAEQAGCRWACSAVLPGSASQANLERCGFRVAYPKVEMARGFDHGSLGGHSEAQV